MSEGELRHPKVMEYPLGYFAIAFAKFVYRHKPSLTHLNPDNISGTFLILLDPFHATALDSYLM